MYEENKKGGRCFIEPEQISIQFHAWKNWVGVRKHKEGTTTLTGDPLYRRRERLVTLSSEWTDSEHLHDLSCPPIFPDPVKFSETSLHALQPHTNLQVERCPGPAGCPGVCQPEFRTWCSALEGHLRPRSLSRHRSGSSRTSAPGPMRPPETVPCRTNPSSAVVRDSNWVSIEKAARKLSSLYLTCAVRVAEVAKTSLRVLKSTEPHMSTRLRIKKSYILTTNLSCVCCYRVTNLQVSMSVCAMWC